ncbi:hypothetical protein [Streptomyces sp. NPDC058294]|uniref:hypothetical protein n=1 Tax=Streptomyces sp. NPDC058294 TaxID=3346430 RepID=UPI0036E30A60
MSRPSVRRAVPACAAVAASVLALASCGQGSGGHAAGRSTVSPHITTASRAPGSTSETARMKQATSVVAGVPGGVLLEGGAERVRDGIHTRPVLAGGKTYRLVLTCLGQGGARLTVGAATTGSATAGAGVAVPCDRSVVQRRIGGDGPVRVDVDGVKGATGVLAWRINTL